MSRKKILILFTSSELGGAEKSLTRLALNLQDKINVQLANVIPEERKIVLVPK